ncbi:MAG: 3-oxoacyl-[acyl-carrier-protein] synthase III C-terminal domain-containing protein [Aliidongia sp.]
MGTLPVHLHGCHYVLGEDERQVAQIPGLAGFVVKNQMIDDPALWGWGRYRVSALSAAELVAETARRSLAEFGDRRPPVDAVILCTTRVPADVDRHADIVGRLLENLGLRHAIPYGVTLNRCATLLAGFSLAEALIRSGRHRAILLAAGDTIAADDQRLRSFAVFSDGAASCVVSAGEDGEYELLGTAAAVDAGTMRSNGEISADLARQASSQLLAQAGVGFRDIQRLAHNNLFKPIVDMKEQQAGFRRDQLYLDNIARIGHVFACDPMINLIDLARGGSVAPGGLLMLGSSVSGARFGALLRKS